jgi:nitrogen fixation protein NifB
MRSACLGEDRGDEFTMDKIDVMEVDYEAAMVRRKAVHDSIIEKLEAERGVAKPKPNDIPEGSRPVLMAVAGKNGIVAEHFGHAREFLIYEASPEGVRFISHRKTELYCGGMDACGDGDLVEAGGTESLLDRNIRILAGCEVVLCSKVGYEPWAKLEAAGIAPNGEHAMEPIEDAVMAVYKEIAATGKLLPQADTLKVA